ncbi:8696_t:CDS:2 [Acaulospora morrowiae]|uniref:8696_t:CDS:1 n=1 Tax=Acaulospora morrowiae TaxID=94023 RepID=A0A9N8ZCE3_9GLOM|nr:8696_t:CDS:2 [Acaulospora morrowiae]
MSESLAGEPGFPAGRTLSLNTLRLLLEDADPIMGYQFLVGTRSLDPLRTHRSRFGEVPLPSAAFRNTKQRKPFPHYHLDIPVVLSEIRLIMSCLHINEEHDFGKHRRRMDPIDPNVRQHICVSSALRNNVFTKKPVSSKLMCKPQDHFWITFPISFVNGMINYCNRFVWVIKLKVHKPGNSVVVPSEEAATSSDVPSFGGQELMRKAL